MSFHSADGLVHPPLFSAYLSRWGIEPRGKNNFSHHGFVPNLASKKNILIVSVVYDDNNLESSEVS